MTEGHQADTSEVIFKKCLVGLCPDQHTKHVKPTHVNANYRTCSCVVMDHPGCVPWPLEAAQITELTQYVLLCLIYYLCGTPKISVGRVLVGCAQVVKKTTTKKERMLPLATQPTHSTWKF